MDQKELNDQIEIIDGASMDGVNVRNLHSRLHKIAGQVNGIDRMVERNAPCEDILVQLNAARSALLNCAKIVLGGHVRQCVKDGMANGEDVEKVIEDFATAIDRFTIMV